MAVLLLPQFTYGRSYRLSKVETPQHGTCGCPGIETVSDIPAGLMLSFIFTRNP